MSRYKPLIPSEKLPPKMTCGIYHILNIFNNKRYIGSAIDIPKRWRRHYAELIRGEHHSRVLQRAWNKYGEDKFVFQIIELVSTREELNACEKKWFTLVKPEYNCSPITNTRLGCRESLLTRKRRAVSHSKYLRFVPEVKEMWSQGARYSQIARKFGMSNHTVRRIVHKELLLYAEP